MPTLTVVQQQRLTDKAAIHEHLQSSFRRQRTPTATCYEGTCVATVGKLKANPANHPEGEGNGNKTYTCGPASSRNMIQDLTGGDYGEHQFELWEGTTSSAGTATGNIKNALNSHFGSYDTWAVAAPTSGVDLADYVGTDVTYARHGTIFNVQTSYLTFWSGHSARHYNYGYGWDRRGAGAVDIAEEWNRQSGTYGYHHEPGASAYSAVHNSPSHSIVW